MSDYDIRRATRYVPHVAAATTGVVVMPVVAVSWLRSRGAITSPWVGVGLALALSLTASFVGRAYWKRRRGPSDLLFGELLVWGWLRRVRMERQLASSMQLLRADEPLGGDVHSASRKFHILSQLAVALEAQDAYTDGHSRRVAAHAVIVARRMGLSGEEVARVRAAAAVHDIGKVRVPREVLDKPGKLTSAEFELVKAHADVGAEIVARLGDPALTAIVRHHHERFDGTGYPSGVAHEQIPLGARVIAVADTFDALTSVRPYRPAASHKRALEALVKASGSQLDPAAVRAFLRCYSGNRAIVFWTLLTVSPQRVIAWLGDTRRASTNASLGSMTTTVGAMTAIGLTAISTPIGPGLGGHGLRGVHHQAPRLIAAVPIPFGVPPRTSHHTAYRSSATPAPHGRRASQQSGRVFTASRGAADRASAGHGSVHPRASAGGSGGKPGGGPRGQPGRVSGGGPAGGSKRGSGGGPAGGSKGGSGGGPAGGTNGGAPAAAPPSRLAGGSAAGSATGAGNGSPGGSSGTSSGGGSSGTGAGGPTTKDQCKNGGYVQYGFPNQGQCVAFVERGAR